MARARDDERRNEVLHDVHDRRAPGSERESIEQEWLGGYGDGAAGEPPRFDQPHGRLPLGWSGSFGSAGEHISRADAVGPAEGAHRHAPHGAQSASGESAGAASAPHGASAGDWMPPREPRRGPKGYQRSSERLREIIYERICHADRIDASDVTVEVREGVVTLHGSVAHRQMKYWIEDIVADTFGVKDVENKLRVALTAPWPKVSGGG
jgi:hypothetical protein